MSLLWQARYFHTAAEHGQLPSARWPEVVFAGRSNAGKSSAINALCQQKQLAFASKTPGRTQSINFFAVGGGHPAQHRHDPIDETKIKGLLVDLPGYGYASVSNRLQSHWGSLLSDYIATRGAIVGLILVSDARRPLLPLDIQLLNCFAPQGKPVHILLTKADKLNQKERALALKTAETRLADLPQLSLTTSFQFFSVLKREGLEAADRVIYRWMQGEVVAGTEEQEQALPPTATD